MKLSLKQQRDLFPGKDEEVARFCFSKIIEIFRDRWQIGQIYDLSKPESQQAARQYVLDVFKEGGDSADRWQIFGLCWEIALSLCDITGVSYTVGSFANPNLLRTYTKTFDRDEIRNFLRLIDCLNKSEADCLYWESLLVSPRKTDLRKHSKKSAENEPITFLPLDDEGFRFKVVAFDKYSKRILDDEVYILSATATNYLNHDRIRFDLKVRCLDREILVQF